MTKRQFGLRRAHDSRKIIWLQPQCLASIRQREFRLPEREVRASPLGSRRWIIWSCLYRRIVECERFTIFSPCKFNAANGATDHRVGWSANGGTRQVIHARFGFAHREQGDGTIVEEGGVARALL